MKKKGFIALCFCSALFLFGCSNKTDNLSETSNNVNTTSTVSISADYPTYDSANSLVDAADLVLDGKVIGITEESLNVSGSQTDDNTDTGSTDTSQLPYTIYEVEIFTVYKGECADKTIKIKQLDTVDSADIVQEKEYLFTLASFPDSYPSLLNVTQSVYELNTTDSSIKSASSKAENSEQTNFTTNKEITLNDIMNVLNETK
ncbi:hypothetical protein [Anaeromicropila populeti]|uniref:Lipoprotein n=1 Tax=Anaeromicropila populeti TaxID=37658 RepID=A0A1I6LRR8_9FIRM|nr:hypothetical protein [Anaeromicropila populeti]SFS06151.1 hypothetical protein SAMN05661086_03516 [Anaeromicropila populeti]